MSRKLEDSHTLLKSKYQFPHILPIFLDDLEKKFGIEDIHINLLSNYEFHENQCSKRHMLHAGHK